MPVTLHTPETIFTARHLPSWLLLAAAAGFADGFAFLTCQQAVSYVTGVATRAGLEYHDLGNLAEFAAIFFSFLAGATAAYLMFSVGAGSGSRVRWAMPLFVVATITAGVGLTGEAGVFGSYPHLLATDHPPVAMLSLLAFAAGLQNASVSATTGMGVRTTHLTGPTTDMGLLLGAALTSAGVRRRAALRGFALRAGIVAAFVVGAGLSLPLSGNLGYLSLLVPAGFVAVAAVFSFLPEWSPSDFPFHPDKPAPDEAEMKIGLPADGQPTKDETEARP